ncbi:MAG: CRISPR-associated helicase Cas3' [Christensenellaceae bacterium]|jgi:CRISPR-associated endonuclease/helicase Cas3|nr:CRISPR-associated helicase Cas3' [Christensenellaceae bacterium]
MPLIAKKSRENGTTEDIRTHMKTTADVAERIYDEWLSNGVRKQLPSRAQCVFLATVHDIGKASPIFQDHIQNNKGDNLPRHWVISYEILRRAGIDDSVCAVLAAHHGKPPDRKTVLDIKNKAYERKCGFTNLEYKQAQEELLALAFQRADLRKEDIQQLNKGQQMLLAGFVILCDWMASSEECPELPTSWHADQPDCAELYPLRFGFAPRPIQAAVLRIFEQCNKPGLIIIEAPMGEGKTEAALAAAEVLAERAGAGGLYFALPTQATSNAMFHRVCEWIDKLCLSEVHTIDLLHGKKQFFQEYRAIATYGDGRLESVVIHDWLQGRKKSILADFAIGTIDHVLMAALKQKHVMLRHLALANKIVVIDECHAYDAYMGVYLHRVLNWLGQYGVPVIILSATLTIKKRADLLSAYLNRAIDAIDAIDAQALSMAYPIITYTNGTDACEVPVQGSGRSMTIQLRRILDEELFCELDDALCDGGCAGIIVNTVKRAQEIYEKLKARGENALLFHSRFTAEDRAAVEERVLHCVGKDGARPRRLVVVGTQVLEQSLDINFDLLVSDLAPMDLLIQRIGRLHRHKHVRPEKLRIAQCWITEHEGSEAVYGKYLLARTRALLPPTMVLPDDIAPLVNATYDSAEAEGKEQYEKEIAGKESRAEAFRLAAPNAGRPSILGLLDCAVQDDDPHGQAAVRDGQDALDVVLLYERERGKVLNEYERMARTVKLPFFFSCNGVIDRTIAELEKNCPEDRRGDLFLLLNDEGQAKLCDKILQYSKERGLSYE